MSVQLALPSMKPPKQPHDYSAMLRAIVEAVGDGELRTLAQIEAAMDFRYAQTSISARLRELHRGYLPGWDREHVVSKLPNGPRHWYRVFRREI